MAQTVRVGESVDEQMRTASPQTRPRRRLGRRWIVAGILVATVATVALAYSLWWNKPTTFGGVGNVYGVKQTSDTMHPVTVDMVQRSVHVDAETITVKDVDPRVVTNTAEALITFVVCHQNKESPFGSADGPAERSCETVGDVDGQRVRRTADAITTSR